MLGQVLRRWRIMSELSMRDAAHQIGIGASTLCRIEQGLAVDQSAMLKIINWLFAGGKP